MDKRKLLLSYLAFMAFWVIDFYTKSWFSNTPIPFSIGSLHFAYYENHGVVMGAFSKLPLVLRTVFLSTIGISLVASFPLLLSLVDFKTKRMIFGLSCLFSGILGNVTDRIVYGYVIDFIYFKNTSFNTPVFNIADAVQWIGYAFVGIGFYAEINYHIAEDERRRRGWINHKFQIKFCAIIYALFFAVSSIFFAFSFTFVKYTLSGLETGRDVLTNEYLITYSITFASLHGLLGLIVLAIGKIISHRISGPIYSLAKYLKLTLEGKEYPFKLREGDQFKELEKPFTELNQEIIQLRMFSNKQEELVKKDVA